MKVIVTEGLLERWGIAIRERTASLPAWISKSDSCGLAAKEVEDDAGCEEGTYGEKEFSCVEWGGTEVTIKSHMGQDLLL